MLCCHFTISLSIVLILIILFIQILQLKLPLAGGAITGSIIFDNNVQAIKIKDAAGTVGYVFYLDNADTLVVGNGTIVEKIRLDTSGNEGAITIDTDGKVGIGTSSPGRKLHIKDGQLKFQNTGSGNWAGLDFSAGNGTYDGYMGMLDSNGTFFIDVDSNGNDLVILQNGKVGIGQSNPYFPLHVQGATGFNGQAKNNILAFDTTSATTGTGGGIAFGGYTNGTGGDVYHLGNIQGIKENSTAGNVASAMLFSTRAAGATPLEQCVSIVLVMY
jgi:hypothetical protein